MIDLSGKRAFVTGGGRGIGRATAVMLSRAGCRVAVGYRSRREDAEETVRAVEGGTGRHRAVAIGGDLGDPAAAERAVAEAVQALGGLDLLIVNHGIWPPDEVPLERMTDAQWDATMHANLDAVLYVCRAGIPLLPDGGKVVLVSSTAGQRGEAFHADYAATKGAVIAFTKFITFKFRMWCEQTQPSTRVRIFYAGSFVIYTVCDRLLLIIKNRPQEVPTKGAAAGTDYLLPA